MRIGVDLGGTKIELIAIDAQGREAFRRRVSTPKSDYRSMISAVIGLVGAADQQLGGRYHVGIGIPGILSKHTGLVKNANTTSLIGQPLLQDLSQALGHPVRVANDANCFTLSEAIDGSGAAHDVVFGVIIGTGVGGGISVCGKVMEGMHGIAGEWGHNPLPSPTLQELSAARACYCGRKGCIETWCSGPALSAEYASATGRSLDAAEIPIAAQNGDQQAAHVMQCYYDRLARALGTVVNLLDPDAIILGGGLSNIDALYSELPERVAAYAFNPESLPVILKNKHGDSSGVRGAAWLWSEQTAE